MAMYEYRIDDNVAVVTMNNLENRFNLESLKAFDEVLTRIEAQPQVNALVTTSAHEKIWSNGIDLDWLLPAVQKGGQQVQNNLLSEIYRLLRHLITMPMVTVAAINGHAFAGGAFLAFAHDFRFMRSDRGWICLPEVDLGMTLGPVFLALTRKAVPNFLVGEMQYTAVRLTAEESESHHIIKKACPLEVLMDEAVGFAKHLNKPRDIISRMKLETMAPVIQIIDETIAALS